MLHRKLLGAIPGVASAQYLRELGRRSEPTFIWDVGLLMRGRPSFSTLCNAPWRAREANHEAHLLTRLLAAPDQPCARGPLHFHAAAGRLHGDGAQQCRPDRGLGASLPLWSRLPWGAASRP